MKKFGKIFDFKNKRFFNGYLLILNGIIEDIVEVDFECDYYILPGLIDSHVHIESSMLIPSRFAEMVVSKGTVAVVSDPHEIANVMGEKGIDFMIEDSKSVPLKFFFGAPSCVPATAFESSGAFLDSNAVSSLLMRDDIWFLSEMMNYPGVISGDNEIMAKIDSAKRNGKVIDGHAPDLSKYELKKYSAAGISTDHECFTLEEALEKIKYGIKIQIRDGSAAKNFDTLHSLISTHTSRVMLCTDDSHPDEILNDGHIDRLIRKGLRYGHSIFDLIEACVYNPVSHYNLPVGLLLKGDCADFIVVDSLSDFSIMETYINGNMVYSNGIITFNLKKIQPLNSFISRNVSLSELIIKSPVLNPTINVIQIVNNQLITHRYYWHFNAEVGDKINSSVDEDILKVIVFNRYLNVNVSVGFVKGFGIKNGALASSVAHDSHNVIAVGVSDNEIVLAANKIIENRGGLVAVNKGNINCISLPFAGLMTDETGESVANKYLELNRFVKNMGSTLQAPFMTLSFLSLLVIPELKIGDKGLFDVNSFNFIDLIE
ncbi:MAG: adenine deaminase [Bacteroidales bacterium]|nr:adenine deaminase [Bacteroidales bacterium]